MSKCGDLLNTFEEYVNIASESGGPINAQWPKSENKYQMDHDIEDPHQDIQKGQNVQTVDTKVLDVMNKA
jgi:hypothetical protein